MCDLLVVISDSEVERSGSDGETSQLGCLESCGTLKCIEMTLAIKHGRERRTVSQFLIGFHGDGRTEIM